LGRGKARVGGAVRRRAAPFACALDAGGARPQLARLRFEGVGVALLTGDPGEMSLTVPAEWAPHRAMWLGFPSHAELWEDDLAPAQAEVAALARVLAGPGGERVRLMTATAEGEAEARRLLDDAHGVEIVPARFGDIWLRDTGPIFARGEGGPTAQAF